MNIRNVSLFSTLFLMSTQALAGAVITYHGRIVDANNRPVESSNVTFKIRILSPNPGKCLLYEEFRNINMKDSDGVFVIPIGDGDGARTAGDPGLLIEKIFVNDPGKTFSTSANPKIVCNSASGYTPQTLDQRQLVVSFDDHSGVGEQILPVMDINFVPLAVNAHDAQNIGGTPAESVLRLSEGTASPLSPANFAELLSLINGSTTQYEKIGQLNGSSVPLLVNGQVLGWNGGAWAAVTPMTSFTEADPSVKTFAKSNLPICGANEFLKDDGAGHLICAAVSGVSGGTLTTVTADLPLSVDSSTASTPKVSLSKAGASTNGYLDKADWVMFNNKLDAATVSGDLSILDTGATTVTRLRNKDIDATAPTTPGQVLLWDNVKWTPQFVRMQDIRTSWGGTQMIPTSTCSSNQSMVWSVVTDRFTCQPIGLLDAAVITTGTISSSVLPANTTRWQDGASGAVYYNGGNVGVGTASPSEKFDVVGRIKGTELCIGSDCRSSWPSSGAVSGGVSALASAMGLSSSIWPDAIECGVGSPYKGVFIITYYGTGNTIAYQNETALSVMFNSDGSFYSSNGGSYSNGCASKSISTIKSEGRGIYFGTTANATMSDGSAALPGLSFAGDSDTGFSRPALNSIAISTSGSEKLRIDSSGNIGIGTTAPATKIDVVGQVTARNESNNTVFSAEVVSDGNHGPHFIGFKSRGTASAKLYPGVSDVLASFHGRDGIDRTYISGINILAAENFTAAQKGSLITFVTSKNGSITPEERMRITHNGNVGIGTTNPQVALDVNGAVRAGSSAAVTACGLGQSNGEGSQRYNYTSHQMEYCNGTSWVQLGGSAVPSGTLCGSRSVLCASGYPSYDVFSSKNSTCQGSSLTISCSGSMIATVSSCPVGYSGSWNWVYVYFDNSANVYTITCVKN